MAQKNYKFKKRQGYTYQSTEPAGKRQKVKIKKDIDIELWGLPPEEYKAMQSAQVSKAKVIGFVNFSVIPHNPIDTFIFDYNGIKTGFPITAKPKAQILMYLCVGKNKYIGLEKPSFKETIKATKTIKQEYKHQKKKNKK